LFLIVNLSSSSKPNSALIIVDVQNDFTTGSLGTNNGVGRVEIIEIINKLVDDNIFTKVIATKDWHPQNHLSFAVNHTDARKESNPEEECDKVDGHCVPFANIIVEADK